MSGQWKAAAFSQKNRQRSTQMRRTPFSGGQQEGNQQQPVVPFFPLDDPVLESVKCHLTVGPRIGFDPISRRFARIAFFIKNRMEVKLISYKYEYDHRRPMNSCYTWKLLVKAENDKNEHHFDIAGSDLEKVFQSLFLRIRKWRFVDFVHADSLSMYHGRNDHIVQIVSQLLDAILVESRPIINIRRFACLLVNKEVQEKIAEFLQRDASNLRYLSMKVCSFAQPMLPQLVQSIGACKELRRLAIQCLGYSEHFPPSFPPMLLGLEKLDGLLVGYFVQLQVSRRCLSIEDGWLPFFAQPVCHPLLKKMQRLNVKVIRHDLFPVATLTQIIAEMRSPARVVISSLGKFSWTAIFNDFLPMVHATQANVLITQPWGIRKLTTAAFATRRSNMPALLQTSLIPPNQYYQYVKPEFRFASGGKLAIERNN